MNIDKIVKDAQNGDKKALENIVNAIQNDVYYLALRMLINPHDAKDATQEILILVITKLSTFQFKSQFKTWVYRVSANYLLNTQKIIAKDPGLTFDDFRQDLESDLEDYSGLESSPEYQLLLNELRISCTMAMLICLNQKHRLAYILGDIFELDHNEASEVLCLSKDNYRKQLSRARAKVVEFTQRSCGLLNTSAKCSCEKKLKGAIKRGRVSQNQLHFADKSEKTYLQIKKSILELSDDLKTIFLQNSVPSFRAPENFIKSIEILLEGI